MKKTIGRIGKTCLVLVALVLMLASCAQAPVSVDYTKLTDTNTPTFGATEVKVDTEAGTFNATNDSTMDKTGFYRTKYIVLSQPRTELKLTITGDNATLANNEEYLVMKSYELNSEQNGWTPNAKGANYKGKAGDGISSLNAQTYTFTYVSSGANECVRLSFPASADLSDVKITLRYAPEKTPTFQAESTTEWWTILINVGLVVILVVVFYFFIIRPSKKQEKQNTEMRNSLNVGDEITTISGIIGEIVSIKEETVTIETGRDKVQLRLLRSAIHSVDVRAADKNPTVQTEETNS